MQLLAWMRGIVGRRMASGARFARLPAHRRPCPRYGRGRRGKSKLWAAASRPPRDRPPGAAHPARRLARPDVVRRAGRTARTVLLEGAAGIPAPELEALEVALLLRRPGRGRHGRAVGLAVLAALRSLRVRDGPVLAAIDDVQWRNDASMETLTYAFRRINRGAAGAPDRRADGASADPLTAGAARHRMAGGPFCRRGLYRVIDLAPLDRWQIQNLLPNTVPAARARPVARRPGSPPGRRRSWPASTRVRRGCRGSRGP